MSEQSKAPVKDYVVQWVLNFATYYSHHDDPIDALVCARDRERDGADPVHALAVYADDTETPLPSYEEVVDKLSLLREMATDALDWHRPGGMRPNHPPELAGCPASALREILRIVWREAPSAPAAHDLTPSKVALAKALDAWVTWFAAPDGDGAEHDAMNDIGDVLHRRGLTDGELTDEGRALLARARKAGVLGVSTEETARLRGELDLKTAVLKMRDDKIAALQAVLASGAPDVPLSTAERAAWARYVNAAIDDRDAQIAEEHYQDGAEEGRARTKAALDAATDALRALCVDVDALLSAAEGQ